jgi:predicted negative regulator of RcsB-dependent stress response
LAQHLSRKELKKDEIRETLSQGADAVLSHQQLTLYILIVAVVVALSVFGWRAYMERQTVKAAAAFDSALKASQAPVGAPPTAGQQSYADENKKFTDVEQKFSDIASSYPHTKPGQLARYYAALSLEKLNKNDDARKTLQGLAGGKDEELAALAQFELAQLDDRTGQADEAVKLYQQLIAKPSVLVPKPLVMLTLASHYGQNNPTEAAKLYAEIKTEFPGTPIADQADQALALLPGKS